MNTDNFNKGLKKLLTLDSIRLIKIGILGQHVLLYAFFTFIIGLILNDIMPDYDKSKSKLTILMEVLIHLIILSFFIYYLRIIVMMFPFIIKVNNFDSSRIDLSILYSEIIIIVIMVIATQMKLIKKINFLFKSLNKDDFGIENNNLNIQDEKFLNKENQFNNQKSNDMLLNKNNAKIEKFSLNNDLNQPTIEKKDENNFKTLISKIKNNIQALDSNSNLKFSSLDSHYNYPINQNNQNIFLDQSPNIRENFSNLNHSYLNSNNQTEYFDNQNQIKSGNLQFNEFPSNLNQNHTLNNSFDNQLSDRYLNMYSNKKYNDPVQPQNSNDNSFSNDKFTQNNQNSSLNDFKQIYFTDKRKNHIEDYFESNKGNTNLNDNDSKLISLEKMNNSSLQVPSYDNLLKSIQPG